MIDIPTLIYVSIAVILGMIMGYFMSKYRLEDLKKDEEE